MQLNYPYDDREGRAGYAPMWYAPTPDNTLRDMLVPPIYAPYAVQPFWPPSSGVGDTPAPTTGAAASGDPLSPITLVSPLPSITPVAATSVSSDQMPTSDCGMADWVNGHPVMAALVAVGVYYFLSGGEK